jgi:predicted ABC-type ATPase
MPRKAAVDLFAVVGPNGSGKSSALYAMQVDNSLIFVNPDDIARTDFSHIKDVEERNRLAWVSCNAQREALLSRHLSFGFETVGSHPSKVDFLKRAKDFGYTVTLLFVATENSEINLRRIKHRVAQGGHDVPAEKVKARYRRTLNLLPEYFSVADCASVWDNSLDSNRGAIRELVHKDYDGQITVLPEAFEVRWVQRCLISKLA